MTTSPDTLNVRAHLFVSGRVQGVNFRYYTQHTARSLGLVGWVRNLWDGRVEVVCEGPEDAVQQLVNWCHDGPPLARVDDVEVTYSAATGEFSGFHIR